jgi:hypothetical protein
MEAPHTEEGSQRYKVSLGNHPQVLALYQQVYPGAYFVHANGGQNSDSSTMYQKAEANQSNIIPFYHQPSSVNYQVKFELDGETFSIEMYKIQ